MSRHFSRTQWLLTAIILVAGFFRFYRLDQLPPGFQFDQAFYVFDSLRLLQGEPHIFFAAPGGTEPLFPYVAMVGVALFGVTSFGLKLTSAVIGLLTIPLIYGLARTLFRCSRIGLLTAFFTAISVWHIYYGRYGERITLLVLLVVPMYWFFWRALERRASRDFVLTGVFLALGLYTNLAARVLPIAILVMVAYVMWQDRPNARAYFKGLCITGLVAGALFLPLGVYFVFHPDQFISHSAQVSIFVPHANEGGDIPTALWHNTQRLLGMFLLRGDDGIIRNVPQRPVFDPFTGSLFVVGVVIWLGTLARPRASALDRRRAVFLLVWLLCGMAISLVTDDAPNFSRLQPIIPAVMILPAWGASALWDAIEQVTRSSTEAAFSLQNVSRPGAIALFGVIALAGAGSSCYDYFVVLQNDPGLYYAFDTDKVEISNWVNQNAHAERLFLAPVTYQVGTISLLTRNAPLESFESRDTIVLPAKAKGKDVIFAFPLEQERKVETMLTRLGALATRGDLKGSNGGTLLANVRVQASDLPDVRDPWVALARGGDFIWPRTRLERDWANQIRVLGATLSPEGPGGRNLTVTLFLQGLVRMDKRYTFSIKARDTLGRVWGQEDKWAGDNSFATTQWDVGDVIVEKFYPGLSACAPAGEYRVTAEAYDPKTMQVLQRGDGEESTVQLGTLSAGPSKGNRLEDLEIAEPLSVDVAPQAHLTGLTLSSQEARAGDPLSLSLFWRGVGDGSVTRDAKIQLMDAAKRVFTISSKSVTLAAEGRGLCTLVDWTVPRDAAPGTAEILVNDSRIANLGITR